MDAKDLFRGMEKDVLIETLQAGLDVARERDIELPTLVGTVAV